MKTGTIVFLLSGSPPLTVKRVLPNNEVRCVWFTPDGDSKEAVFSVDILTTEILFQWPFNSRNATTN